MHKHCYNIINIFYKRKIIDETNKNYYTNYCCIHDFFRSFYYRNDFYYY